MVHNGVDELFRAAGLARRADDEFVVTFVGNVVAAKGPHLVCQAADLAARLTGRPFRVRVVGDAWYGRGGVSPYESWLRQQCDGLGTPVEFVPHVDRHRVADAAPRVVRRLLPERGRDPADGGPRGHGLGSAGRLLGHPRYA